jgi:hypothetical protein
VIRIISSVVALGYGGPMNGLAVAFVVIELELEFTLLGWLIWRLI